MGRNLAAHGCYCLTQNRLSSELRQPLHDHPHEQAGMLIEGRLEITLGEETRIVEAGAMVFISPNVPHRVHALEASIVLDVFSLIREDYAEKYNKYIPAQ